MKNDMAAPETSEGPGGRTGSGKVGRTFLPGCLGVLLAGGALALGATPATAADSATECAKLTGMAIPASAIALPTGGAAVLSAQFVQTGETGGPGDSYCRLLGRIAPDAAAAATGTPEINFQLNLPARWNGKALQMGGGGYNGTVVTGTTSVSFTRSTPPLYQGYATYGSDSGHVGLSTSGDFGANAGALRNFAYEHLKKTHDAAFALIEAHYGRRPERSYFGGASTGGREGMTVVQRFPADYDGVIANAPAIYFWGMRLIGVRIGQAAYGPSHGYASTAKFDLLREAVLKACDAQDGATDGMVSDVASCRGRHDEILASLRCKPGANDTAGCLTEPEIGTVRAIEDDLVLPYPLAYGVTRYPGYTLLQGADFARGLGMGSTAARAPVPNSAEHGYLYAQGDAYLRYFVTGDMATDALEFDLAHPGRYQDRIVELSGLIGAMNPDTTAFQARGGKLIVLQGLADDAVSSNGTEAYYRDQVARYGQEKVDAFFRLYMVPGFGHGRGAFVPAWDAVGALDEWVTKGTAPGVLVGRDTNAATAGRARPLCPYPGYPRRQGEGDMNAASSFACVSSQ